MTARLRTSLFGKLLAAQLLVIVAGSATLAVIAIALAPSLFHDHVREALGVIPEDVSGHLDDAFEDAVLIALAVATAVAVLMAALVSWFLAHRIVQPVGAMAITTGQIASGHYDSRVAHAGTDELGRLAAAFNEMAASLQSAEARRHQLLSDVAHELRTPLATIDGYLEAFADGVIAPDAETVGVLRAETARLRRLADDLHTVSRAEARQVDLQIAPMAPGMLVDAVARAWTPAYRAGSVDLRTDVDPRVPEVAVDEQRMAEVLGNLLDNALRHTPPGGHVVLSASCQGDAVDLAVTDSGEGVEPAQLPRLFERFYRTDAARTRARGGSGIGLTIARALVEAQGGSIRAESEGPGRGARFTVTLRASGK